MTCVRIHRRLFHIYGSGGIGKAIAVRLISRANFGLDIGSAARRWQDFPGRSFRRSPWANESASVSNTIERARSKGLLLFALEMQ
jgi:hypothetical protein